MECIVRDIEFGIWLVDAAPYVAAGLRHTGEVRGLDLGEGQTACHGVIADSLAGCRQCYRGEVLASEKTAGAECGDGRSEIDGRDFAAVYKSIVADCGQLSAHPEICRRQARVCESFGADGRELFAELEGCEFTAA